VSFKLILIPSLLLFNIIFFSLPARAEYDLKQSVIKIYTTNNRYNYYEPWQMKGQGSYQGSGSVISGHRILTNAHVVSDHTFIQVRKPGDADKYTARLEIIAHESDLAILKVDDESFFKDVQPLDIGELSEIRDKVAVYGYPEGGDKLSITEGVVSRVEHVNYAHSGAYLLTCQIDASINPGNSGGPVLKGNKIIGVAFQSLSTDRYDNIGYMVPAPVIKHFLDDIKDGKHDGTPDLGISMQQMENPDIRASFHMPKEQTGILVNRIYPDSPAKGILSRGDIIFSIDGISVANDGTIEFRSGERTFFTYLLQLKQINDKVDLGVLRDGRKVNVTISLTGASDFDRLVPQRQYDVAPTYYITGGLVFEPLTLNYLMEFGSSGNWYLNAPVELMNFYLNGEQSDDQREAIVLVKVLADQINAGYYNTQNVVITYVNGVKVSNMRDVVKAFEKNTGEYHVVEDIRGYKITLGRKNVDEHSLRILKKYKIDSDRSVDLKEN